MQRRKNIRLLVIWLMLLSGTIILISLDQERDKVSVPRNLFIVEDTAAVNRIVMQGEQFNNILSQKNGRWLVNDVYQLDEGLRQVLLSVLKRIQVQRPVARAQQDEIIQLLQEQGIRVEIYQDEEMVQSYLTAGNRNQGVTYFMQPESDQPYIVHLPGYESYVAGLYEITENDWRDRIVMTTNWNSLNYLSLTYPGQARQGFTISYARDFFQVEGLAQMDTTKLMDYLERFQYILTDRYLDRGEDPIYDSLAQLPPYARLEVEQVGQDQPDKIEFFPRPEEGNYILGQINDDQLALFEYPRISELFRQQQYFLPEAVY
ncbi:MAG: hypothetical protein ACNS62_04215 [Candidatus Cyclobacteriaceae bacterium M3_2C_046]